MKRRKFEPRIGQRIRVLNAVNGHDEAGRGGIVLTPDITATVCAINVPCVRLRVCETCGRKHQTFNHVEFVSPVSKRVEHASVHDCNMMEWVEIQS